MRVNSTPPSLEELLTRPTLVREYSGVHGEWRVVVVVVIVVVVCTVYAADVCHLTRWIIADRPARTRLARSSFRTENCRVRPGAPQNNPPTRRSRAQPRTRTSVCASLYLRRGRYTPTCCAKRVTCARRRAETLESRRWPRRTVFENNKSPVDTIYA